MKIEIDVAMAKRLWLACEILFDKTALEFTRADCAKDAKELDRLIKEEEA